MAERVEQVVTRPAGDDLTGAGEELVATTPAAAGDQLAIDLGQIEAKLKQSEDMQMALRMTSIKTRRDVLALLTPEQRAKEKAEHEKGMEQHREGGSRGHASGMTNPHGGAMQGSPHKGGAPMLPSDTKGQ